MPLLGYFASIYDVMQHISISYNTTLRKSETKNPHDTPRHTRENNNNMDVTRMVCDGINCIQVALDR